jgi:hypothetical protein
LTRGLALGEVEIEGVKRPVLVAIGGDEEAPIIGYTALEILGFKVNQITRRLERTPAVELVDVRERRKQLHSYIYITRRRFF